MNFLLFLATLLHVAAGLLFCGLPLIAFGELFRVRTSGLRTLREALLHAIGFGLASLFIGSLMAGAQWNESFDAVWEILGMRWIYLFMEMAFSLVLIALVLALLDRTLTSRRWKITALLVLFLAATNSLYHFPSLMVLTREIRHHPDIYEPGGSMAALIFSPPILFRWLHLAIAALLVSAVWYRLISAWFFHGLSQILLKRARELHASEEVLILANPEMVELREVDWRGGLWAMSAIVGMWLTGLTLLLVLPPLQVGQLTALTSGKSNQLMVGVVLATFVGVRCLANSTRPSRAMRVLDVSLLLVTIASMIDAVSR